MKRIILLLILFIPIKLVLGQHTVKDSISTLLSKTLEDTTRVNLLYELSQNVSNRDSAILLRKQALTLAQSIGYTKGEIICKQSLAFTAWVTDDFALAIKLAYPVLEYAYSVQDTAMLVDAYAMLVRSYRDMGDYQEALKLLFDEVKIVHSYNDCSRCLVV
jgi:hypothetical protein